MCDEAFPQTSWGRLAEAQRQALEGKLEMRQELLERYCGPVYRFFRSIPNPPLGAEDLTAAFFERLMDRHWIGNAAQAHGRFRDLLRTMMRRFVCDLRDHRVNGQLRFERGQVALSLLLTEEDRQFEPATWDCSEAAFAYRYAQMLVDEGKACLERRCEREGKAEWYGIFRDAYDEHHPQSRRRQSEGKGLTEDQVRYRLEKAEEWFKECLNRVVAREAGPGVSVEQEVCDVLEILDKARKAQAERRRAPRSG